uniref:Uncharacterized protein n=1 Tax=Anopheles atroparvus TaxID=41427 RepID=A0A182IW55_ANOAO
MKFAGSLVASLALVCLWVSCANATLQPVYGALAQTAVYPAPTSYVARAEKARVGIYPAGKYGERSGESSEEHSVTFDHYDQARQCVDSHGRLLPVSICVQLPPEAPMKLSKGLLQRIVYSLVQEPTGGHKPLKYDVTHEKPCEYPRKPCKCAKKPHESYEKSKEVYTTPKKCYEPLKVAYEPPKKAYEPPKKVYEPTTKPCGKVKESYEPPKKTYVPKGSYEESRYESVESYEAPRKPYTPPKKPCNEPKEYYTHPQEHYTTPPKAYTPPTEVYKAPTEHYNPPKESYHRPSYKEPCGVTEPPYHKTTTHAPYTTAAPAYTQSPAHRPTPYHPTATYAPYEPRYPSVSYHAPSYPKPAYEHKPAPYKEPAPTVSSSYPKPPKKGCGCVEPHRPYYNTSA